MGPVHFPEQAEADLVGVCVDSHSGFMRARQVVDASDFYRPSHARLVGVCEQMEHLVGSSIEVLEDRIHLASRLSDVPERDVRQMVTERAIQGDRTGHLARQVKRASEARAAMAVAAAIFERLSQGEPVTSVGDLVGQLQAVAA